MFENKKIHLIGIGGISMSGIAKMLVNFGATVTGSNTGSNEATDLLINDGITVYYEHDEKYITNQDIVVYTAAISDDNPELVKARKLNIPTVERAEFLGEISKIYENCICISGTHGKSTTTGLTSMVFLEAGLNPTIQIGAMLPEIGGNIKLGNEKHLIMEACEYVDSFLHFHPTAIIITNIDNDHLDYFKNLDNIKASFLKYSNNLPENGILVINADDENSLYLKNVDRKVLTYGINNEASFNAKNISFNSNGCASYDIYQNGNFITNINLSIPGKHNVYNSLAVFTLATNYIKNIEVIKNGIEKYHGVGRRFEFIGNYNEAMIYDDYAHHPTEIKTTLNSVSNKKHNTCWAVFQAHTYSRTFEHLNEFAEELSKFDNIIIAPIYAAREENIWGVSEEELVNLIKKHNKNVIYIDSFDAIVDYLKDKVAKDDIVLTVGAGPVNEVAVKLKNS